MIICKDTFFLPPGDSISSIDGLAGSDYKRQIAIMELMDTEETFMKDMSIVLDVSLNVQESSSLSSSVIL